MKTIARSIGGILLLLSLSANAQLPAPALELTAGPLGSFVNVNNQSAVLSGGLLTATMHLSPSARDGGDRYQSLGLALQLALSRGKEPITSLPTEHISFRQYLAGPQFAFGGEHATVNLYALFGAATIGQRNAAGGGRETGLSKGAGVALDLRAGDRISIRIPQLDYISARFPNGQIARTRRISAGILFRWNGKNAGYQDDF